MSADRPPMFRTIHHVDQAAIDRLYAEYSPVFVLTTGRAGSRLLVDLLNLSPGIEAVHEPRPTLQYFSNFAYHHQDRLELLTNMLDAARMERVLEVMIRRRVYVEANQCLTFFAPAIAGLFQGARFIHLVRHPGDFVRSAWRKGWHRNDSIWERGRLRARDEALWESMGEEERLAWLWAATNLYVENFKATLPEQRCFTLRLEDLVADGRVLEELSAFCGGGKPDRREAEALRARPVNPLRIRPAEPPNMKKRMEFPRYPDWPPRVLDSLIRHAGSLAGRYRYPLVPGRTSAGGGT